MTTYLVAAYDCAQNFGGSEEGGWWYDGGELVRVLRVFRNATAAFAYTGRLNAKLRSRKFGPNAGKHDYTSVLSEGEIRAMVYENTAPPHFPATRPRYE